MQENETNNGTEDKNGEPEITDNLELLKELLPEDSFARVLLEARQIAPQDSDSLEKIIDKRLEQMREGYADAANQVD